MASNIAIKYHKNAHTNNKKITYNNNNNSTYYDCKNTKNSFE